MVKYSKKNRKKRSFKGKKSKLGKGSVSNSVYETGSNVLVEQLYKFLKGSKVNKEVNKLIHETRDQLELYKSLRKDTENEIDGRYVLSLTPDKSLLWSLCQTEFVINNDDIYEYNWPSGDWKNYEEATQDATMSWIYDYSREEEYPGMLNPEETGTSFQYAACIYLNFVIPYVMAKYSLLTERPPKNMFIFVHYGGGAGALVNSPIGKVAYTCSHTLSYDNKDMNVDLGNRQYLIMLSDGRLALLGNATVFFDEYRNIDAGIAKVIKPTGINKFYNDYQDLSDVDVPKVRGRSIPNPEHKITSWGSPSLMPVPKSSGTSYSCDHISIPNTDMNVCWWDPLYFYYKEGYLEGPWVSDDDDFTFQHNALVWEGMSGGPIMNNENKLIGIHHRGDGMAMRADNMHELFDI